jgi:peroxiredoxin
MSRFRRLRRLATPERIGWALLVAFLAWRVSPQAGAALGFTSMNQRAPDFQLTTLEGTPVTLDSLRGKVVFLNFWATWCPPCRVEMPGFQDVWEERRGDGFVVLGVSTDRAGRGPVVEFLRKEGITDPVAMANGDVVNAYGGARVLPTSFLIDRDGRIRHEVRGYFSEVALRTAVGRLLDEAGGETGGEMGVGDAAPDVSSGRAPARRAP